MILHSTANTGPQSCMVRLEDITPGTPDAIAAIFARGAAAKHNPGYLTGPGHVVWCDVLGIPLPSGADTSTATVARVTVELREP